MQTAAKTSRILTSCSSKAEFADAEILVTSSNLLQQILAAQFAETVLSQELFLRLTNALIHGAEQAYFMRDIEALDDVSTVLMNLPVKAAQQIGTYYYALAIIRAGRKNHAQHLLEEVADEGPITYRARAVQTLGANHHASGQIAEALRYQLEACRIASDKSANGLQTRMLALWEISISRSLDGDHKGALSDLKSLRPVVNLIAKQKPFYFYAFCNALAVEFGELGRHAEAQAAIKLALASPYAPAYPNWAETQQEIEAKCAPATRPIVAVHRAAEPEIALAAKPQSKSNPSGVLCFYRPAIDNEFFQRSVLEFPAKPLVVLNAVSVLHRMLGCIGPRAPPR